MTSKMRDVTASDILTIITEEVEKLRSISDGELFNMAKQNHRLLARIDEPGFLTKITAHDLSDSQMDIVKEGTLRDTMLMTSAAIIAATQDSRPESLIDLVSSLYGPDLYPQLVSLGKTGVLPPAPVTTPTLVTPPVPAAFEGGPA